MFVAKVTLGNRSIEEIKTKQPLDTSKIVSRTSRIARLSMMLVRRNAIPRFLLDFYEFSNGADTLV